MSDIWDICSDINDSFEEEKKENKTKDNQPKEKEIKCENCGSKNFIKYNNEKIICEDCNLVAENIIDYSQEWRYYGSNDNKRSSDPNRCGAPSNPLFKKPSLTTCIGFSFSMTLKTEKNIDIPLGSIKTHNAIIGIFSALENAKWKKYMMVGKPFLSA